MGSTRPLATIPEGEVTTGKVATDTWEVATESQAETSNMTIIINIVVEMILDFIFSFALRVLIFDMGPEWMSPGK